MANSVVRPHVPEEELHAYCDGELSPMQRVEIAEHLLSCLICRSQHAMVEAVRMRTATLLAIAVPVNVRRLGMPAGRRVVRAPSWARISVAVAAALVGVGVWFALKPEITGAARAQLAASLGVPTIVGFHADGTDSIGIREKQSELMSRANTAPQVRAFGDAPRMASALTPRGTEVDPVFTAEWTPTDLDAALKSGGGSLARISGVPVAVVRIHPSSIGGRPTFMVRQQLPDGRAVWVFEGLQEDIAPVNQVLQASGIAMSMVTRTKPDYVGTGADLRVTTRMVTVVGYLPVDSLNALVARLTLR